MLASPTAPISPAPCCGALGFGWLTDRIGRKKLFFITLALYLTATAATALSWNVASYALFRFLTGAGIGGEYTAINSTIQELVPARYRGWTDLVINGSFWIGAAIGAVAADRAARSQSAGARSRLAAGLFHRRRPRPDRLRDADVDSGKPALADDPWPSRGGPRHRRRRSSGRRRDIRIIRPTRYSRRSGCGCAAIRRWEKWRIHCSRPIGSVRW